MKTYQVKFIQLTNQWAVINNSDGVAQSLWDTQIEAHRVVRDLNRSQAAA